MQLCGYAKSAAEGFWTVVGLLSALMTWLPEDDDWPDDPLLSKETEIDGGNRSDPSQRGRVPAYAR